MATVGGTLDDIYSMDCSLVNINDNVDDFHRARQESVSSNNIASSCVGVMALATIDAVVQVKFHARILNRQ